MIKFLWKGILRDANRSRLPIIIITIGVFLTVVMSSFMKGVLGDMIDTNAKFATGHVKIMTKAYAENEEQIPNDLALIGTDTLLEKLSQQFPELQWAQRIRFGGLMDVPDAHGETREQGPVTGLAVDLRSPESKEVQRLNMEESLVKGSLPAKSGEVLISDSFAEKLQINPGDTITFFGSTMYGSMTFQNFKISGTVHFGSAALDRGAIIIDLADAQAVLDMDNTAGEILGYFEDGVYDDDKAQEITAAFNRTYENAEDVYAPVMLRLTDQNQLREYFDYSNVMSNMLIFIFVVAMSIVLWNTGLLGGLRRYKEFGVRLALGEEKSHIYKTLLYESVLIGAIGSTIGTAFGLIASFLLQEYGLDFSGMMQNASMMMPSVIRAAITPEAYYIGFIPGLFSMVLGNALSGIGIYQRNTAQLFKELEV